MKKVLLILGGLVLLLIVAIIVLPIIFKDDIQKALDDAIAENVDATVFYDVDQFSLSLIKSFPDITVSMGDFGVVGNGVFENDTLVSVQNFLVTVDLMSAISGEQIIIEEISLDEPNIYVKVLPDGTANYDIAMEAEPSEEPVATEETPEETTSEEATEESRELG